MAHPAEKRIKMPINARQAVADSCRFTRSHQAAAIWIFSDSGIGSLPARQRSTTAPWFPDLLLVAVTRYQQGLFFIQHPHPFTVNEIDLRAACGLAYTSPSVPCISSARPPNR